MLTIFFQYLTEFLNPEAYRFSAWAAPYFIVGYATTALGVYVFLRERNSSVKLPFFGATVTVSVWLFTFGFMLSALNVEAAHVWSRLGFLGIPFIPAAILHFTVRVLRQEERRKNAVFAAYVCAGAFMLAGLFTDWIQAGLYRHAWGLYPRYALPGGALYFAYFAGLMGASLWLFVSESKKSQTETQASRIRWLLIAFSVGSVGIVDFLPKFGIPVYAFGYLCVFGFVVVAAKVVTQYRLYDITPSFAVDGILNTMGDALLVLDSEDLVRVANDAASRLFQIPKTELVGSHISSVSAYFPVRDSAVSAQRVGTDHSYEIAHARADGMRVPLEVSESSIKDGLGCVVATVLVIRDVSRERAAQRDLEDTERRFADLYRDLRDAVVVLDEFGRFGSVNPAAEKLLRVNARDLVGRIFVMSNLLSQKHVERVLKAIRNVMDGVQESAFEIEITRDDGVTLTLEAAPSAVRHHGRVTGVQLILRVDVESRIRRRLAELFKDDAVWSDKISKLEL